MTWDTQLEIFDAIVDCCPRFAHPEVSGGKA